MCQCSGHAEHLYCGDWKFSEHHRDWIGNPVDSAQVRDIMHAIKHKIRIDDPAHDHSAAMRSEHMFKVYDHISSVLSTLPLLWDSMSEAQRGLYLKYHFYFTFSVLSWTLWARCVLSF
jgi:hypothetical protein